jgi:nucleoside-diphosphate-sugar epimerase
MKHAIVTGGGGFVGLGIVKALRAMDIQVSVIGRHHYPQVEEVGGVCLVGDIRDAPFVKSAFVGADTVFHVAAKAGVWGSWEEYFGINVTGTENVIDACRHNHIQRLVYTSTPSVVFNRGHLCGVDETTPYATEVLCHYARSKIMAEILVLETNDQLLSTTAIRPHLVWGPGDTNLIPRLLERAKSKQLKIVGDSTNMVDIAYIDNVVDAHIKAALNLELYGTAAGQAFFISQGEPVNLWGWINELFMALDRPLIRSSVSFKTAFRVGSILEHLYTLFRIKNEPKMTRFIAEQMAKSHWFSVKKAQDILKWQPEVSTIEGMQRLVEWIRKEGL